MNQASQLEARPTATTFDLEDLVTMAWDGQVRVPRFQRDFRWVKRDVVRLFDSIVRGYPIGSLLLWVRDAPAQTLNLGALQIDAPASARSYWVVDGQQRVTSLASALHRDGVNDPRFSLAYDLKNSQVVSTSHSSPSWEVPLPILFDLQSLLRWFSQRQEAASFFDQATAVAKALRQYKVPAYEVTIGDEEVLRDIFDRMNNYGKRLSRAEVFNALHMDKSSENDPLTLELIAEELNERFSWGRIDADTVLRAVLARRGADVTREIRNEFDGDRRSSGEFQDESQRDAYDATGAALGRAILFLRETAGVPHFSLLPYRYLLVILVRLFSHHPDLSPRNTALLRRWFWRAALAGPEIFKGSATGAMRALAGKVQPGDQTGSLQALLESVPREVDVPRISKFRTNEAAGKILLCSLWDCGPHSPLTGEAYSDADFARYLDEAPTAASALQFIFGRGTLEKDLYTSPGNRLLLPDEAVPGSEIEVVFAQPPLTLTNAQWAAVLASHLLDPSHGGIGFYDPTALVQSRGKWMQLRLDNFISRMTEPAFEDTPPLGALELADED